MHGMNGQPPTANSQRSELDDPIHRMYAGVCFEAGTRPDWQDQEVFAPGARMIRINDNGVFPFDVEGFRRNFEQMIDSGELPSFWEGEIWREERVFGEMAHVLSAYEMRRSRDGEFLARGVNSIQLYKKDGRWWICAMIWRRDGKDVRIPAAP